jgi:hypothetical protein
MRRDLDVVDVEVATKIRAKYLRALENEEFGMLPDPTLVKTFLRTYAEHLGLDAQLLVEEYRAQYEPRGEGELPAFAARAARGRDRRRAAGPPIGPGTAVALAVFLLLVVLAVIGLTGGDEPGDDEASPPQTTTTERSRERRERRRAAPRTLRVRVVPAEATYVCLDDGRGKRVFEGTISTARTFRGRRLRINLGRTSARLTLNGRRVPLEEGPGGAGFSFSRSGAKPLPLGRRPCA